MVENKTSHPINTSQVIKHLPSLKLEQLVGRTTSKLSHLSQEKNNSYFQISIESWLFNRDQGSIYWFMIPYNWVVYSMSIPLYTLTNQGPFILIAHLSFQEDETRGQEDRRRCRIPLLSDGVMRWYRTHSRETNSTKMHNTLIYMWILSWETEYSRGYCVYVLWPR